MDEIITRLMVLNNELIPPYYLLADKEDVVTVKPHPYAISKEIPKFDIKYFDLVALNILLANHNKVIYHPPAEVAELVCNMFYIANLRHQIYTPTQAEKVYECLAFNTVPPNMLVYQFMDQVLQQTSQQADVWFVYILLLWGFTITQPSKTHPYRSRFLVGYINKCYLTANRKEHEHDIVCDNLKVLDNLKSLILLCTRDKRYQDTEFINYAVDSIRAFVVVYLAALIRRSCTWPEFCKLGDNIICQKNRFHNAIVQQHYEEHKKTGAVNQ